MDLYKDLETAIDAMKEVFADCNTMDELGEVYYKLIKECNMQLNLIARYNLKEELNNVDL